MQFTPVPYSLAELISQIEQGTIGLPEIQRPFVWKAVKVRDLFDSMYQGFPVGFLLFWKNVVEAGARPIGVEGKRLPAEKLVVDGQQRLTSLFAVMRGRPVLTSDFKEARIQIAFRPSDERFDVASAAMRNDPEWIPDISAVWREGLITFVAEFIERLRKSREVSKEEEKSIGQTIQRLYKIESFHFTALELASSLDEEQVAEIFVRINSEGVKLNQADFILTLMSVWWDKGRKELEAFSRDSRVPSVSGASPFNWFVQPNPDQLLRVSVALAFGRARLQHVYSILRGKDLETGEFSPEKRELQFERLREAQEMVLDLNNWHEFFNAVTRSGYRGGQMVMSQTNLMYCYATFLIGLKKFDVDKKTLRRVIARWFFMTSITSRYTGSSETQMETDLGRLNRSKDAEAFVAELDRICDSELTNDFFQIRLPNDLVRSGTRSPMLFAYEASQVLLGANALFSDASVVDLIDPAITGKKSGVERHHLFPRAHLKGLGVTKPSEVNQLANYALVEWAENISIGGRAPEDYYSEAVEHLSGPELAANSAMHALPDGWQHMDYWEFLDARRRLMAQVVRRAWETLAPGAGSTESDDTIGPAAWSWTELVDRDEGPNFELKSSARWSYHRDEKAKEIEDAVIKTVAAFMNTWGGTLVIGVDDDGTVLGLDRDFSTVQGHGRDGFDLWIHTALSNALGKPHVASLASVSFGEVESKTICRVDVRPASKAIYAKTSVDDGAFYVRTGAKTEKLTTAEATEYISHHWKGGRIADLPPLPAAPAEAPGPIPIAAAVPEDPDDGGFDWAGLHLLLDSIPSGRWATYGDLAEVVGTAAMPLGQHISQCSQCSNPHRVLTSSGEVAEGFAWRDPTDTRSPVAMLEGEGIRFVDGRAETGARLRVSDLQEIVNAASGPSGAASEVTMESLVDEIDEAAAAVARAIHEDWVSRSGTWVVPTKESLVMYAPNPRTEAGRCHVASLGNTNGGSLWINPGRIEDSGAFDREAMSRLRELMAARLPPTTSEGKGYYQAFTLVDVDPVGVRELFDFVLEKLAQG